MIPEPGPVGWGSGPFSRCKLVGWTAQAPRIQKADYSSGDSQTDTGFNLRGPQPDEENPIGNPAFPGRTGSYGANYLGHMTVSFNQSFIRTYNMANKFSPFFHNTEIMKMPSFGEQIEGKFLRRYGPSTKLTSRGRGSGVWSQVETLFVVYIGPDDIMQNFEDELESRGTVGMEDNIKAYMEGLEKVSHKAYGRANSLANLVVSCMMPEPETFSLSTTRNSKTHQALRTMVTRWANPKRTGDLGPALCNTMLNSPSWRTCLVARMQTPTCLYSIRTRCLSPSALSPLDFPKPLHIPICLVIAFHMLTIIGGPIRTACSTQSALTDLMPTYGETNSTTLSRSKSSWLVKSLI